VLHATLSRRTGTELMRLRALQDSLEALIVETRQLRDRIEFIAAAHRFASRVLLGSPRKRRRLDDLSRANRVF
jgi:hypothetical protein